MECARPCEDKMEPVHLHFMLNLMNGNELEISLPAWKHFADLREEVSKHWKIPTDCQRFYHGIEPLNLKDSDTISMLAGRGPIISLTVLVSTEQLVARLESSSSGARAAAVGNLAQLGTRAAPQVEQICLLLATDPDHRVRRAAANALPNVVVEGNEEVAVNALIAQFEIELKEPVQQSIVAAMATFSGCYKDRIIAAAEDKIQSEDPSCRRMGLMALALAAPRGDERATAAARRCLGDADAAVRRQALQSLVQVSVRGDETLVSAACDCVCDQCSFVKSHALGVLRDMVQSDDDRPCALRARELIEIAPRSPEKAEKGDRGSTLESDNCQSVPDAPLRPVAAAVIDEAPRHRPTDAHLVQKGLVSGCCSGILLLCFCFLHQ